MNELELLLALLLDDADDAKESKESEKDKDTTKEKHDSKKLYQHFAAELYKFYEALIDEGFSNTQAWELTLAMFKGECGK